MTGKSKLMTSYCQYSEYLHKQMIGGQLCNVEYVCTVFMCTEIFDSSTDKLVICRVNCLKWSTGHVSWVNRRESNEYLMKLGLFRETRAIVIIYWCSSDYGPGYCVRACQFQWADKKGDLRWFWFNFSRSNDYYCMKWLKTTWGSVVAWQ